MRLADFILANIEPILSEWEAFARTLSLAAKLDARTLRDNAEDILRATVRDMGSSQSAAEQSSKSRGHDGQGEDGLRLDGASELHAMGRLGSGFDLTEVVSEYRAVCASVLRLWGESRPESHLPDVEDLTRFNESIDQSLGKAVSSFTRRVDQARDMFLAILSHDLRNPLNSIAMSAQLLPHLGDPDPEAIGVASQIAINAGVMGRMISDLLDYTRTRLGAGMPVAPAPMDLGTLCRELFDEFRTAHPKRQIRFKCDGDLRGEWDSDRLRQAVSNLMGNAIQHGDDRTAVDLSVSATAADVTVTIRNGGTPILPGELTRIFDPLVQGSTTVPPRRNRPGSIGLGLYIAREIARSHGGRLDVTSSAESGTAFTIYLPRHCPTGPGQPILDEKHIRTM